MRLLRSTLNAIEPCTEGGANANGVKQQPLAQAWHAVGCPSETDVS